MTNNMIQTAFEQYMEMNEIDAPIVTYINDTNYKGIILQCPSISEQWLNKACYHIITHVETVDARWRHELDNTFVIDLHNRSTVFTVPTTIDLAHDFD